jgi:hypothetical protein
MRVKGMYEVGWISLAQNRHALGSWEHGNAPAGSINEELLD